MVPRLRAPRILVATLTISLVCVATRVWAQTSCSDEPGFAGLLCVASSFEETAAGSDDGVVEAIGTFTSKLVLSGNACAAGKSSGARRRLARARKQMRAVSNELAAAARGGRLSVDLAATLGDDLRLLDSLRRATLARITRHPCPELVEVLRPSEGEAFAGNEIFLLLRILPEADALTLTAELTAGSQRTLVAIDHGANLSDTQAWARVPCLGPGPQTLRIRISERGARLHDEQQVSIVCGAQGFALGAEVESLVDTDDASNAIRLIPVRPLRSGAVYAAVATRGLATTSGKHVAASADFRAAVGRHGSAHGVALHYAAAAADPRNPFPSERLVNSDGTMQIPDGFTARALPADARLDGVRTFLRNLDTGSAEHHGFSPNQPVVLSFDAPIDLETTSPDHLFLVELSNPGSPGSNLGPLLDALARQRHLKRGAVVGATVFQVEDVSGTLATVRDQVAMRAMTTPPQVSYVDPNPSDARAYGIFTPSDMGFADFFTGTPPATVGIVARGTFLSPDYRENGRFPARFLDGSAAPPEVPVEFLLAVPAPDPAHGIVPPFPTVILQHGFCGDDSIVTQQAGAFTAAGLAVIGIPAPEHGPRGNCLDFFNFDDFNAFGNNFRQASVDLMALVQLVVAGIDLDADSASDLKGDSLGYLGVSLGGVIGGVFTAVEPLVSTAVLNVPGGRLSQLAGASSPFAEPFLAHFATASNIAARTCGGTVSGSSCSTGADCAGGAACLRNPDFTLLLQAAAPDWQSQLDPGDGSAYARWLRLEPRGPGPKPVLVQEGIGDQIVANPLTEALGRAIALPADRPDGAPGGVAGLWHFPPPTGHGILGLDPVRDQAITFLHTQGQELARP
jgi:hypothetical protein